MELGIRCYLVNIMTVLCYSHPFISDTKNHELFCFYTKSAFGRTECIFLRKLVQVDFLLLYWTVWTEERIVTRCLISADSDLIQNYLSFCRDGKSRDVSQTAAPSLNVTPLLQPGSPCEFHPSGHLRLINRELTAVSQVDLGTKMRQKRAWTLPGTLWCGLGNSAAEYEQLGMFEQADRCCREHDHCNHVIRPFTVNFGMFNPTLFTISHCDCDNRFKQCLLDVNDTISNTVGYTFFNVLKLNCFHLIQKRRCTQISWLGICTSVQTAPFAILKNPTTYNATRLNTGVSAPPVYLERATSYHKQKSAKSKKRTHSKAKSKTIYTTVGMDNFLSREEFKQSYGRTKELSPRSTTTQPSWLIMRTSTVFHLKNQTKVQQKKLQNQASLRPAAANITHRHTISLVPLPKVKLNTLISIENCTSKESPKEETFWPKQNRRKIYRVDSALNQKPSPLTRKFRRRNKCASSSKLSNIVSIRTYTVDISTSATSSNVTKLPKTRNVKQSNFKTSKIKLKP